MTVSILEKMYDKMYKVNDHFISKFHFIKCEKNIHAFIRLYSFIGILQFCLESLDRHAQGVKETARRSLLLN